jgi:hypothetical protein
MGPQVSEALRNALMITAFVAVMMIAVEYLNILTRGTFESALRGSPPHSTWRPRCSARYRAASARSRWSRSTRTGWSRSAQSSPA